MCWQQVIDRLDPVAGKGDLGVDDRIDQQRSAIQSACELLLAPVLPAEISRDPIEDPIGFHAQHQGSGGGHASCC